MFAQMEKVTLEQCDSTAGLNLTTLFRKCEIYPLSRRESLHILPRFATGNASCYWRIIQSILEGN